MARFGTNAIPQLLMMLQAKDGRLMSLVLEARHTAREKLGLGIPSRGGADAMRDLGLHGFALLGSNAVSAVPALTVRLTGTDDDRFYAHMALGLIGIGARQPLESSRTSTNHSVRWYSALALGFGRTNNAWAVTSLTICLRDSNRSVRARAARSLGQIRSEPRATILALIAALDDSEDLVRESAAWAFGEFGAQASNAVPKLIQLSVEPDRYVQSEALAALKKIDPLAAAEAGFK